MNNLVVHGRLTALYLSKSRHGEAPRGVGGMEVGMVVAVDKGMGDEVGG